MARKCAVLLRSRYSKRQRQSVRLCQFTSAIFPGFFGGDRMAMSFGVIATEADDGELIQRTSDKDRKFLL